MSMETRSTSQLTHNQHSINSQLIVSQLLTDYAPFEKKLTLDWDVDQVSIEFRVNVNWGVDWVSIECQSRDWVSIKGINPGVDQHLMADAFSTRDLIYLMLDFL